MALDVPLGISSFFLIPKEDCQCTIIIIKNITAKAVLVGMNEQLTIKSKIETGYQDNLRVAAVNFQPIWGNKEANLEQMILQARTAADNGAQLIVFPEMCLTGYAIESDDSLERSARMQIRSAETLDGTSAKRMAEVAKEKSIYIIYGYPEKIGCDQLNVYNSAVAISPQGNILGSYRKIHPFDREVLWAKTGSTPFLFDSPWGPIGISICYDTYNYPELVRYYAAKGARLLLNPTATTWAYYSASELVDGQPQNDGKPYNGNNAAWLNRFQARIEAITIQNGVFLVSADLVGAERNGKGAFMGTCFPGGTCVVGPTNDQKGTLHYIDYCGTDPALATDVQIVYSNMNLANAKRNSFTNYIKTDIQEGNLYAPALYAKWYKDLEKSYVLPE